MTDFVEVVEKESHGFLYYVPPFDHQRDEVWTKSNWVTLEVEDLQKWLLESEHRLILESFEGSLYVTIYNGYAE